MKTLEQKAREYISEKCGLTPKDSYYSNIQNAYFAGATEMTRWRDVNEELPEQYEIVLCKEHNDNESDISYMVASYTEYGFWVTPLDRIKPDGKYKPTHWRPIETI